MDGSQSTQHEAEYAGYVDKGTQIILQDAIQKIVETFSQTDALEDILSYLENIREDLTNHEERIKEIQNKQKQTTEKMSAMETSITNLLQRIQSMEVQVNRACEEVKEAREIVLKFAYEIIRLTEFFEQPPFKRLFSRLKKTQQHQQETEGDISESEAEKIEEE